MHKLATIGCRATKVASRDWRPNLADVAARIVSVRALAKLGR